MDRTLTDQVTASYKHYVGYAKQLKIRYFSFECLIMIGVEDCLVRKLNPYVIRLVCLLLEINRSSASLVAGCHLIKPDNTRALLIW